MKFMKTRTKNLNFILFFIWVFVSFIALYSIMVNSYAVFTINVFCKFSIYLLTISVIWLGYIFTNGKLKNIGKHLRELVVIISILIVASFTVVQWTGLTTNYGGYDASNDKGSPLFLHQLYLTQENSTIFEKDLLYQGAMRQVYDLTLKQIWTFGAFMFVSTFLLLKIIPKKE